MSLRKEFAVLMVLAIVAVMPIAAFAGGHLVGQIWDANTGEPLPGCNIVIEGTKLGTATDLGGNYSIPNVPAGTVKVVVTYLGYTKLEEEVIIAEGAILRANFKLTSTFLEAKEVVFIGGQKTGQARALNQQMTAGNVKNVIAADQIDKFPDPNTAEALQRVPAIAVQRDQGEGRYITIRGTDPNLNNVKINGQRIPSPEGDVRQVALDVVPADALGTIEIDKTLTPDMDGDAIGGSVNLVTRSAFDYDRPSFGQITLGGGYNAISENGIGQGAFNYGRQMNKNLAIMVNGSYYVTARGSDNQEMEWGEEDIYPTGSNADDIDDELVDPVGEDEILADLQLRDYTVTRTRASLGTKIDYRYGTNNNVSFNAMWNQFGDQEYRRRTRVRFDKGFFLQNNQVTDARIEKELKDRYEIQRIWSVDGTNHTTFMNGMLEMDNFIGYAYAEEEEPDRKDYTYVYKGIDFSYNTNDPDTPTFSPTNGTSVADINNPANYEFDEIAFEDNLTTDDEFTFASDFKYHMGLMDAPGFVKAGFKFRMKNKDRTNRVELYTDVDATMQDVFERFDTGTFIDGDYDDYDIGLNIDPDKGDDFFNGNTFEVMEDLEGQTGANYEATENVTAAYLMGNWTFNRKFTVIAGARVEMTDLEYTGYKFVIEDDELSGTVQEITESNDYMNVLPALNLRYQVMPNANIRAAFSQSIARPKYYDLVPYEIYLYDDNALLVGNPELDPSLSTNFDLLGEYYMEPLGVVSAGFFMKSIDNYMYTSGRKDYTFNGTMYDEWSKPLNAEDAGSLMGFEFSWNQQFSMLPGALSGLGIYGNYTYTESEIDYINEDGTKRTSILAGQSKAIYNVALTYEKFGFSGQIGLNYTGKQILEVGESNEEDAWLKERLQVDLSASYRVWKGLTVYGNLINLTDEPYVVYLGDEDHPIQREFYKFWGHLGVKFQF